MENVEPDFEMVEEDVEVEIPAEELQELIKQAEKNGKTAEEVPTTRTVK